jgi:hypothetical protein
MYKRYSIGGLRLQKAETLWERVFVGADGRRFSKITVDDPLLSIGFWGSGAASPRIRWSRRPMPSNRPLAAKRWAKPGFSEVGLGSPEG